ncbi:MAG: glycosyl transferase family 28 [Saprospiraceae bacterium]|nr:glycosyl transferase family 28 [Saprospiraceae bacterium]
MAKKILVAALDWGIGHASRCVPIITDLQKQGAQVYLAASGRAYHFFQKEFPNLPLFHLAQHNFKYYSNNMVMNMAIQWPKIVYAIWKDQQLIRQIVKEYQINGIISDNRFGCFHQKVHSVFMSHQLHLKLPALPLANWVFNQQLNHRFIQNFDACWVPDSNGLFSLSGNLSQPPLPIPTSYLGILSRLQPLSTDFQYEYLFLLSGPEPQRTRLEQKLLNALPYLKGKVLLVQGKTEQLEQKQEQRLEVRSFLTSKDLAKAIASSRRIICRSGYSTLMDLVKMNRTALLIPTPGQTEQEYLAKSLSEKGFFTIQSQKNLNLENPDRYFIENVDFSSWNPITKLSETIADFLLQCGNR